MTQSTFSALFIASALGDVFAKLDGCSEEFLDQIRQLAASFWEKGPSPAATFEFEQRVQEIARELARRTVEVVYNAVEPADPSNAPHYVEQGDTVYRRVNVPTANRHVATLFGKITLTRLGYRDTSRDSGEPTIFPLEMALGLVEGATPALACAAARALAETGATQQAVLARMRREHGVEWGVKKLRALAEQVSIAMTPLQREQQAAKVVEWLKQAQAQRGSGKPVLAVGRDGITLCTRPHRFYEVATTATITVYDRRGQRLGTVYLGYVPELGQDTMTDELTALIQEILRRWTEPLPRLSYITDAGDSEVKFFRRVLRKMRHPVTGKRLDWQWIVDFYHASERLHTMGVALFGEGQAAFAWAPRLKTSKVRRRPARPVGARQIECGGPSRGVAPGRHRGKTSRSPGRGGTWRDARPSIATNRRIDCGTDVSTNGFDTNRRRKQGA